MVTRTETVIIRQTGDARPRWGALVRGSEFVRATWADRLRAPFWPYVETLSFEGESDTLVLRSMDFEDSLTSREVFDRGRDVVLELNSVMAIVARCEPLEIAGAVEFRDNHPPRRHLVMKAEPASYRWGGPAANLVVLNKDGRVIEQEPRPSREQDLIRAARLEPGVALALKHFQAGSGWFDLYKAFESIRDRGLAKRAVEELQKSGSFTHNANLHRHRKGKFQAPQEPMSISTATIFVRNLIETAVNEVLARK